MKITWPSVALVAVILAAVCVLAYAQVDTSVITNLLILLGVGGILGAGAGLKDHVNGNTKQQLDMLRDALQRAFETPAAPPPPPDPAPADDAQ